MSRRTRQPLMPQATSCQLPSPESRAMLSHLVTGTDEELLQKIDLLEQAIYADDIDRVLAGESMDDVFAETDAVMDVTRRLAQNPNLDVPLEGTSPYYRSAVFIARIVANPTHYLPPLWSIPGVPSGQYTHIEGR